MRKCIYLIKISQKTLLKIYLPEDRLAGLQLSITVRLLLIYFNDILASQDFTKIIMSSQPNN